ncbi:MAG TPA: phospholipase D family protein [Limnobacter sp.]|nr:phospholipase D family protein [Limnobacter sp.]
MNLSVRLPFAFCMFLGHLQGCALPPAIGQDTSYSIDQKQANNTRLGEALSAQVSKHQGKTGAYPLHDPKEAFQSRMLLTRAAQESVDIQSYIWKNDTTGNLMLEELLRAGQRGVRVRLLLDDNGISGLDTQLNRLDTHPNIEVRLFNPFQIRNPKWLGYLADFSRLNRRMHNKSFTVDNMVTISGGRNIGDEYFGLKKEDTTVLFTDLDLLCIGEVVGAVSNDFDVYWNSPSAYPSSQILDTSTDADLQALQNKVLDPEAILRAENYLSLVRDSGFLDRLLNGGLRMHWAQVKLVSDKPGKVLDKVSKEDLLALELREFIGNPKRSLNLVSPYFVPTEHDVAFFSRLANAGVRVQVLTNSLEATDVAAVHSGYAESRAQLLRAGVSLFELKGTPREEASRRGRRNSMLGSSGSSLHTKTFSVDGSRLFVGSFNFDPRSVHLNTEMGFLIQSPGMASQVDLAFQGLPAIAYQVRLDETGSLVWIERRDGKEIIHDLEPKASLWRKAVVFFYSLLPIRGLL